MKPGSRLIEGELYANAAVFRIEKENVQRFLFTGISPAFCDIVQGEERSQGVELNVTGRVLPGWDVMRPAPTSMRRSRKIMEPSAPGTHFPTLLSTAAASGLCIPSSQACSKGLGSAAAPAGH
ncbi:MAG: hypothetical protein C4293_21940 [Nitrospiraceae bacterium]